MMPWIRWLGLARQIDVMRKREELMAGLIRKVAKDSDSFTRPLITMIGGYALRAFVPFARYTRDCDFVLPKGEGWEIDRITGWFGGGLKTETLEKHETYGFLRLIDFLKVGSKSAPVAIDFMEGEVRGRTSEQVILIDDEFVKNRTSVKLRIGPTDVELYVPNYIDYFILKVVSGRPSDVRDIAALVWENDIPDGLDDRIEEILPSPSIFRTNIIESILPDISDKRFVESWRGTFVVNSFDEEAKEKVLERIRGQLE
jgi:hypothetical protein